jgi:hypothetical protein
VHRTAFTRGAADGNPLFNPFDFTLKNVANTGVLAWGGKLYALYEVGGGAYTSKGVARGGSSHQQGYRLVPEQKGGVAPTCLVCLHVLQG